ncbi:MAG: hypothetical protein Q8L14_33540 [Myxococcales bacterium]|nr:hypothetical protein [Myxococcales bacterium]
MNVVLALVLTVSPELDEGRLQMSGLRYKAAVPTLSKVAASTQLPVAERIEANELLARAHLAMGDTTKAEAAYDAMLTLDPMAAEPRGAPKLVAAFLRAKERRCPRGTVLLERRPRAADVVEVHVINPWRTELTLQLMTATTGAFSPTTMPRRPTGRRRHPHAGLSVLCPRDGCRRRGVRAGGVGARAVRWSSCASARDASVGQRTTSAALSRTARGRHDAHEPACKEQHRVR